MFPSNAPSADTPTERQEQDINIESAQRSANQNNPAGRGPRRGVLVSHDKSAPPFATASETHELGLCTDGQTGQERPSVSTLGLSQAPGLPRHWRLTEAHLGLSQAKHSCYEELGTRDSPNRVAARGDDSHCEVIPDKAPRNEEEHCARA